MNDATGPLSAEDILAMGVIAEAVLDRLPDDAKGWMRIASELRVQLEEQRTETKKAQARIEEFGRIWGADKGKLEDEVFRLRRDLAASQDRAGKLQRELNGRIDGDAVLKENVELRERLAHIVAIAQGEEEEEYRWE
jgi:3-phenylpropionate/cinnamic acid dioxygenase small subunit